MLFKFGFVLNVMCFWDVFFVKILMYVCYIIFFVSEWKEVLFFVMKVNFINMLCIIYYVIGYGILLYRFLSLIVLFVIYLDVWWDFVMLFCQEFCEIGELVRKYDFRMSFYLNQFIFFISLKQEIIVNVVKDMVYYYDMLDVMGIVDCVVINIYVGGVYGDK